MSLKKFLQAVFFLLCLGIIVGSGCDESLPPRDDPKLFFKGDIFCSYIYSVTENDCSFFIDVTNIYHETIQDTAAVQGTIEIMLKRNPQYHKTIRLSLQNFHGPFVYDSIRNLFTIDPGKKVTFAATWNFIDDNQIDLTTAVFKYTEDPACSARLKSQAETFIVKGSIQIISRGEIVPFGPKEFNTFSVTPSFIVNRFCPPFP